jgi:hypothetical protein
MIRYYIKCASYKTQTNNRKINVIWWCIPSNQNFTASVPCSYLYIHQEYNFIFKSTYVRGCIQIFRTGRLERELQMVQLSTTRWSCIAILCVSLVSFAAITLCVASQRVFIIVSVYFVIDSVRKLLVTPSYMLVLVIYSEDPKVFSLWNIDISYSRQKRALSTTVVYGAPESSECCWGNSDSCTVASWMCIVLLKAENLRQVRKMTLTALL